MEGGWGREGEETWKRWLARPCVILLDGKSEKPPKKQTNDMLQENKVMEIGYLKMKPFQRGGRRNKGPLVQ